MKNLIIISVILLFSNCSSGKKELDPAITAFERINQKIHSVLNERKVVIVAILEKECNAPGKHPCQNCLEDLIPLVLLERRENGFSVHTADEENSKNLKSFYFHQTNDEIQLTTYYSIAQCLNGQVAENVIRNNFQGKTTKKLSLVEFLPYNLELNTILNGVQDSTSVFMEKFCRLY